MRKANNKFSISVIIPTYNRAKYIKKALKSVLNQSYSPSEVLICDDGSADNTKEIVKKFRDKKIKWIAGKHSGLPAIVRNRGIKKSSGEWIAFLDSDDYWDQKKLEKQIQILQHNSNLACSSNAVKIIPVDEKKEIMLKFNKAEINFYDLLKENVIVTSSVIAHRSLFKQCGGFPIDKALKGVEDYALWLKFLNFSNFVFLNQPLVFYLEHPEESVRKFNLSFSKVQGKVLKNLFQWSKKTTNFKYKFVKKIPLFLLSRIPIIYKYIPK